MRTFVTILLACFLFNTGYSQVVTLKESNVPILKILNEINKQTGYYYSLGDIKITDKFTINVNKAFLKDALDVIFKNKPYTYTIVNKIIVVLRTNNKSTVPVLYTVNGKIENEKGEPLGEATIQVLNTHKGTVTNSNGAFSISGISPNSTIQISSIGYETQQVVVKNENTLTVQMKPAATGLDETVVIGYGKTSQRLNTGNVYKVRGQEIVEQPVSNFAATLPSRVPGLLISQQSGIPGTGYKFELRGKSSMGITLGTFPEINTLILVDGIPFSPNNNNLPVIGAGAAIGNPGRSAFDLININDIESIEVLKDADATAIYGSRGANGVILVTTKKGAVGKPTLSIQLQNGVGQITRYPDMMNTQQYIAMRRSAIINDGNTPNISNAPDIYKWDTTRYTDLKKMLIGGTAQIKNTNVSLSGGNNTTQYLLSYSWKKETTVFPGDFSDNTFYTHASAQHRSKNNKFNGSLSLIATHDNNWSLVRDLTAFVSLPPNVPSFYDSVGNLIWQQGGYSFNNPMSTLRQPYHALTNNILTDVNVTYSLLKNLTVKINGGINNIRIDESLLQPQGSQNTFTFPNAKGQAFFAESKLKSFIVEPQINYSTSLAKGKLAMVFGSTYQQLNTNIINQSAFNFPNDASITDFSKAETHTVTPTISVYKYVGAFGRLSYDWMNKYIINFTGRRDGSSRFGPGRQYGNFGAIGAAWIFSKENFAINHLPFLSFGKLRTSYGVTGSDQIGDYRYLGRWAESTGTYQGLIGIEPIQPDNTNYSWETNKKAEAALELGFFNNKLFISSAYYRHRSGNQIISVPLPSITGFDRLNAANYPAVIQNSGIELVIQVDQKISKDFSINSKALITIPKNKLLRFPNLSNSLYTGSYLNLGSSISTVKGFKSLGVDKSSGLYKFYDHNGDGTISYPDDYSVIGNTDPKYYGSLLNNFQFKNWNFEFLVEFRNQWNNNMYYKIYNTQPPGFARSNMPVELFNAWRKEGDQSDFQKFTASTNSLAYAEISNFLSSSGVYSNASYVRLKYLSLSYTLSSSLLKKLHLKKCKFYVAGNNLAIITPYVGTDPETINTFTLPPLRIYSAGFQMSF